ncbi:hypothetical protein [Halosimplex carlsbadense]|uniref:hypothetical protein n=1 Tax=Halosimplex carlsbadense TaxID=171164 RepID=UPI001F292388|nr:hypothetical protein [Halosimplex carlsbadense]
MPSDQLTVSQYRAVMTTTDRERIAGEADVDDSKRYQAITRVRNRIEELETDVQILEEHHPDLLDELRGVVCGDSPADLSFTPLGSKNVSYGPSSRADAAFVLRVGTEDGTVELHLDEDEMYELWTEVQHTPWPDTLDEQEEAGRLRQRLVDLAMGADEEMLRDALNALDPHWRER